MGIARVVLDTNIVVSGLRSRRGASHKVVLWTDTGKFETCLSVPLFLEYQDACQRLVGVTSLNKNDVDDVLDYLCRQAEHINVAYLWRPFLPDLNDDMVLELAVAGGCDHIVTYNLRDFKGVEEFGIGLWTPKQLLQQIGAIP